MIDGLQHKDMRAAMWQLFLYCCITLVFSVVGIGAAYSSTVLRETFARNVQLSLVAKVARATFDGLSQLTLGQISNRVVGDVRALTSQLEYSLFPTLSNICALLVTLVAIARLNYILAIVALACSFSLLLPLHFARLPLKRIQERSSKAGDVLYGLIVDAMSLPALAAFRGSGGSANRVVSIADITKRILDMRLSSVLIGGATGAASSLLGMIGPALVLAIGAYLVMRGSLSVGGMVTILIYQSRLSGPVTGLSGLQMTLTSMSVSIKRLLEIVDLPDEESGAADFQPGALSFDDVSMSRGDRTILDGVSVTIDWGKHVAIVGSSGAGKSTLAALLIRLYDPDAGAVRIGPLDVRDMSLRSLRASVSVVPQDPFLLDASVRDNIIFGRPIDDEGSMLRAIRIARLDSLIRRLPEGLETKIGFNGFKLSGGERQRICIARALMQDPQILLLDEALTGVEVGMELEILADIRREYQGRTLIVVTHRLNTLEHLDDSIALDGGHVENRAAGILSAETSS
jgi:ABC-type bacteriocin/lantibiotic exporter with double-glycine peptidase domain